MADLRVFLAARMTFDATLEIDHLVAEFLENYYGGGTAAAKIGKYIKLMTTAYQKGNRSVDFTGRILPSPKEAHLLGGGPNSSIFANETLLAGATLLTDALRAATEPQHKERVAYDLMHLQYVLLVRWDSLRLNSTAMEKPWPLHDTKEEEFAAFAAAYNVSGIRTFTEHRVNPRYGPKNPHETQRYIKVSTTLASFHAELFGDDATSKKAHPSPNMQITAPPLPTRIVVARIMEAPSTQPLKSDDDASTQLCWGQNSDVNIWPTIGSVDSVKLADVLEVDPGTGKETALLDDSPLMQLCM